MVTELETRHALTIMRLRAALEEIVNPLQYIQERAAKNGNKLSGQAYSIANSVPYLQGIARAALKANN